MKQALYKGPDISKHNGNVNIKKVRDAGYKRIGIRAGYGKNNVDEKYVSNALACVNLGVLAIIYWFSYAFSELMAKTKGTIAVIRSRNTGKNVLSHMTANMTLYAMPELRG